MNLLNQRKIKTLSKKYSAVTLLETLVYVAIFGLIFLSVMEFMFMVVDSNRTTQGRITTQKTRIFLVQHLEKTFLDYDLIDVSTVYSSNNCVLQLSKESVANSEIVYQLSNSRIDVARGDLSTNPISPANIVVTSFGCSPIYDNDTNVIGSSISFEFHAQGNVNQVESITTNYLLR